MTGWTSGAAALLLAVCAVAAEHSETHQRTFTMSGGERRLTIENISGYIRVAGGGGNNMQVTVRESWKAASEAELLQGRSDVRLEMTQEGNHIRLWLDGPFRNSDRRSQRDRSGHYRFRHDFDVQVPHDIDLMLKTINGGEVQVSNVRGEWNLRNINGRIELEDVAGHGTAETINGRVAATFTQNPQQPVSFKTLNGEIDVMFQPELSADLRLETMHGDAYTDFDVTPTASSVPVKREGRAFRYRSDRSRTVRAGSGGVQHSFKTLNGVIKIKKYQK